MAEDFQAALLQHDRVRRSCDLPIYYGETDKDTISARDMIERLETTARIAEWATDKRKCEEFYLRLRGEALTWWKTLQAHKVDRENWNAVKTAFLKYFEPKYTASTACSNLQDLHQRSGELVHRYYLRLFNAMEKFRETQPALEAVHHAPAAGVALAQADLVAAKKEGADEQDMFMRLQLFVAGLDDPIRTKVMEAGKVTLGETVDYAIELERIQQKEDKKVHLVQEARRIPPPVEDLDDEEREAINAIRMRKGKPPFQRFSPTSTPNRGNSGNAFKCWYCRKPGHQQKECRSRIRDGAPMVNRDGKSFRRINNVEANDSAAQSGVRTQPEEPSVSSIHQTEPKKAYHLNW